MSSKDIIFNSFYKFQSLNMNHNRLNISPPKENVAASTQNQALCAILFLYRHVLEKEIGELHLVWPKKPKRLPVVFTRTKLSWCCRYYREEIGLSSPCCMARECG